MLLLLEAGPDSPEKSMHGGCSVCACAGRGRKGTRRAPGAGLVEPSTLQRGSVRVHVCPRATCSFLVHTARKGQGATAGVAGRRHVSHRTADAPGEADPELEGGRGRLCAPSVCTAGHGGHLSCRQKEGGSRTPEDLLLLFKVLLSSDA